MVEDRSYLIGARSKLASFHSAGDCSDDNDIVSALRVIEQMISFGTVSGPLPRNLQTPTGPTLEIHATGSEGGEVARLRRRQDASSVLPAFDSERGIISTVDVVIRAASEPYGILEVDRPVRHNNDEHDVNLLTRFANILADVTSLGLVISESIANSYAHAFPGGAGSIRVQLSPGHSGDETALVFADDGVGFPELRPDKRHGVGLVMRLREHICGSAAVRSYHGTEWALKFPTPDDTRAGSAR